MYVRLHVIAYVQHMYEAQITSKRLDACNNRI